MSPTKVHYCKYLIRNDKDYYRRRIIQIGEQMGAWFAESRMATLHSNKYYDAIRIFRMYSKRFEWYIKKYSENNYDTTLDFET